MDRTHHARSARAEDDGVEGFKLHGTILCW
jgi:hypothetical protein